MLQGPDKEDREFCAGLPVAVAVPWIERLRRSLGPDTPPEGQPADPCPAVNGTAAEGGAHGVRPHAAPAALAVAVLDAELEVLTMSKAASYGLPEAWVARLTRFDPVRRQARPCRLAASWRRVPLWSCCTGNPKRMVCIVLACVAGVGPRLRYHALLYTHGPATTHVVVPTAAAVLVVRVGLQ